MTSRSLRSFLALSLLAPFALLAPAAATSAAAKKNEGRPPLEWLEVRESLSTGYLSKALTLGSLKVRAINLSRSKDKFLLVLDPNVHTYDTFGDPIRTTKKAVRSETVTLKLVKVDDPRKEGRRVYAIEGDKLPPRLFLVEAAKREGTHRLVVKDKTGRVGPVLPLQLLARPRIDPCHPGCFPAGTEVQAPGGPRSIETIRAGDDVVVIGPSGKVGTARVASVFVGQALLVEVETDKSRLMTTGKQPLCLMGGETKSAIDLVAGDELVRWQGGKAQPAKVRRVIVKQQARIFNLVLDERGNFIANGYLVRSKPPAEP
jgi:hypothetical protein